MLKPCLLTKILLEKSTKTHNCAIFSFCKHILCSILWMHFVDQNMNTRNHVSLMRCYKITCRTVITNVNYRIWKKYKKGEKVKKENAKVANRKLGKAGNLGKVIPSFQKLFQVSLFPSFRFCPTAKIENSDLKISGKNSRYFRVFGLA